MHLMALGMFVFEISTLAYDELKRRTDWRFAKSGRVGTRDAAQFLGVGDETIGLSGSVYAEIADGRVSLDTLSAMADKGEALPLVGGDGTVFGQYLIQAMSERHNTMLGDGRPLRIDFDIELWRADA